MAWQRVAHTRVGKLASGVCSPARRCWCIMSGNHYTKQVSQLEHIVNSKLSQLRILEDENKRLKQKEAALQSCIMGIEGSCAATKAVLEADPESAYFQPSPSSSGGTSASCSSASRSTGQASHQSTPSGSTAQAVLEALEAKEQQVQNIMAQLGCSSSSDGELYSTSLLRRVTSNPAHVAAILAMDANARREYLVHAVHRMGLLLPKYDSSGPITRSGSAKQQLDALLDDLSERILTAGLLDPPQKKLGNMLINLESMEYEPYPEGYWTQVAANLQLTEDQKAALKMCWSRVRANKTALASEHEQLSARLSELQEQLQQKAQQFEQQAMQLHVLQLPFGKNNKHKQKVVQRQKQQQLEQASTGAMQQQQLQQPSQTAVQQLQQQQTQACSPAVTEQQMMSMLQQQQRQQQLLMHQLQQPQYQQQEEQMREAERLLFSDLNLNPVQPSDYANGAPLPSSSAAPHMQQWGTMLHNMQQQNHLMLVTSRQRLSVESAVMQQQQQEVLPAWLLNPQQQMPPSSHQAQQQMQQVPAMTHSVGAANYTSAAVTWHSAAEAVAPATVSGAATAASAVHADGIPQGASGVSVDALPELKAENSRDSFSSAKSYPQSEELLLQVHSREQIDIEKRLHVITEQIKMQHFCQALQFVNTLTKKQLAEVYVNSWPYVPDALSICEALDELGW